MRQLFRERLNDGRMTRRFNPAIPSTHISTRFQSLCVMACGGQNRPAGSADAAISIKMERSSSVAILPPAGPDEVAHGAHHQQIVFFRLEAQQFMGHSRSDASRKVVEDTHILNTRS